jgi:hypothetical protein
MAIAPKQIGWSQESNLLWEISKQLDTTISLMCIGDCPTTTTTTTIPTTTTTTTPTPLFLVNGLYSYGSCEACPPNAGCISLEISLYLEQACIDLITVGCHIYQDALGTINAAQGYYARWDGTPGYLYIDANGLVANINVCPQP